MLVALLAIIALLLILDYYIQNYGGFKVFNAIPGPPRLPLVGNGLDLLTSPTQIFYKTRTGANVCRLNGNIFKVNFFHLKILSVYEPDDIEVILSSSKHIQKNFIYDYLHSWLNEGLLTSKGDKWQRRRKLLTPTFHFNILRQFCKTFVEQSTTLITKLKDEIGKEETSIIPYIMDFTLLSINETAMGTKLDFTKENVNKYKNAIYHMGEILIMRFSRFWLQIPFIYYFTSIMREEKKSVNILHNFTTSIIRERRLARNEEENNVEVENMVEENIVGMKKRLAMLDLLFKFEAGGQIDENGIREEVDTFMFEGHDTTTMGISFTLMLLANHPEVQDKIFKELQEVLGGSYHEPTMEDFNKMNYLEMCIKESLRLYPSVPVIGRRINEEIQLRKYRVPAGTVAFIHIFDVHRNPDLFRDPDTFIPERFLPENSRNRHPYSYIPFSAGPRNCIGQRFALLEEKAVISAIIWNFILQPITKPDDIIFLSDLVLRARDPIKMKFVSRNHQN